MLPNWSLWLLQVPPQVYEQDSDIEVEDPGYGGQFGASQYGNQFYKKELSLNNKKQQQQSGESPRHV